MRKKSKYKPKYPGLPVTIRFSKAAETDLCLVPQSELDKFRNGLADDVSINTITFRLNLGYVLSGEHFNEAEARGLMESALAAVRAVKERLSKTGKVGATGEEYHAMADGLKLTDEMQAKCTRRELRDASNFVVAVAGRV
jgi:hypothetical protein